MGAGGWGVIASVCRYCHWRPRRSRRVGRLIPRFVPAPRHAAGPDTLWQPDGMQMELRKGAYLSLNTSLTPSTPAVCHAPLNALSPRTRQLMCLAQLFLGLVMKIQENASLNLAKHEREVICRFIKRLWSALYTRTSTPRCISPLLIIFITAILILLM